MAKPQEILVDQVWNPKRGMFAAKVVKAPYPRAKDGVLVVLVSKFGGPGVIPKTIEITTRTLRGDYELQN